MKGIGFKQKETGIREILIGQPFSWLYEREQQPATFGLVVRVAAWQVWVSKRRCKDWDEMSYMESLLAFLRETETRNFSDYQKAKKFRKETGA
jgi:hypothetical protein